MLTSDQKKFLRGIAHDLKTIIWVGQKSLTENVLQEIETALDHHELLKIKIRAGDREARDETTKQICNRTGAELVQRTGNVISLYRKNESKPKIRFP